MLEREAIAATRENMREGTTLDVGESETGGSAGFDPASKTGFTLKRGAKFALETA